MQIGLVSNANWLKGVAALNARGEIIVDHKAQTSVPGLFAAGDVTDGVYKQIIIAMAQGATAGLSPFDYLIRMQQDETPLAA